MVLTGIKKGKEKNLLLLAVREGEENARYTVREADYAAIGRPAVGDELDAGQTEVLLYADEYLRAKKKALSLLSYSDNSKRTLYSKLARVARFRRDIAEEVVREMVSLGYIDEERQVRRLIERYANNALEGPLSIISRLVGKGYSAALASRTLDGMIASGEVDFEESLERLKAMKLPEDYTEEQLSLLLHRYGYKRL